jgi:precorrin-3B synthase
MSPPDFQKRGACPALYSPMQTGDGLLVRLNPASEGLSARQLIGLCESASRHGNGIVEITARGSLQIRGLTAESALLLAQDVDALGINPRTGVPVDVPPLAGIDPAEITDPRPLAAAIRQGIEAAGLAPRLGPKVSVVVDGGGAIGMGDIIADVRVAAGRRRTGQLWRLSIGGTARTAEPMGAASEIGAAAFVVDLLSQIAEMGIESRARDLLARTGNPGDQPPPTRRDRQAYALTQGRVGLCMALAFGNAKASSLAALTRQAASRGVSEFRLSPGRMLIAICPDAPTAAALAGIAANLGFIIGTDDPRLMISACAGAPACRAAHFATRALAERLASEPQLMAGAGHIHISGCSKGCAHPAAAPLTLVGAPDSIGVVANGTARDAPSVQLNIGEAVARLPSLIHDARRAAAMERQ